MLDVGYLTNKKILCNRFKLFKKVLSLQFKNGSVAQLNRAPDYGSEGWGFDSLRGHKIISHLQIKCRWLFIFLHTSNRPEYSGGDLN